MSLVLVLKGNWFGVFTILMRQSCSILNKNKILIIFMQACIVFTYGYEGIISSFVTVPSAVTVFETLESLLKADYKVDGFPEGNLRELFRIENITLPVNLSMTRSHSQYRTSLQQYRLLANFTTMLLPYTEARRFTANVLNIYSGKISNCHLVKQTTIPIPQLYYFSGEYHVNLRRIEQIMQESGILLFCHKLEVFVTSYLNEVLLDKRESDALKPFPFSITDEKIYSIFLALSVTGCLHTGFH